MLDSGVFADHPHIQRPLIGGITITPSGEQEGFQDRLGHGTAVCALLQQMAPDADILAVKIFDTRLATSLPIVLRAIDWCLAQQIDIINLSLGTANQDHLPHVTEAIERTQRAGIVVVSAYRVDHTLMLPGSLSSVIGVVEEPSCTRESIHFVSDPTPHVAACPYPLDIPGVPRERNIHGVSFAVAHVTARIANRWHASGASNNWLTQLADDTPTLTESLSADTAG